MWQDLLKEVTIFFITSTIVWPQVKQQGGNTAPFINRNYPYSDIIKKWTECLKSSTKVQRYMCFLMGIQLEPVWMVKGRAEEERSWFIRVIDCTSSSFVSEQVQWSPHKAGPKLRQKGTGAVVCMECHPGFRDGGSMAGRLPLLL